MNAFAILGAVIAALVYIPLTVGVWRKTLVLNFATFFLWGLLDLIAAGSIALENGNFLLPAIYAVCSACVFIGIFRTRTFGWSWRETATSVIVLFSIIVWLFVTNEMATIASTAGGVAAGLPQLYDIWKKPQDASMLAYGCFTVANALSTIAGRDWSVQERLYGSSCTILTLVFVIVGARKWLPKYREKLVV